MLARIVTRNPTSAARFATRALATRTPIVGGNWSVPAAPRIPPRRRLSPPLTRRALAAPQEVQSEVAR